MFQANYYGSLKHAEDLALRQGISQSTLESKSFHKELLGRLDKRLQQIAKNSNSHTGAFADDLKQTQRTISRVSAEVRRQNNSHSLLRRFRLWKPEYLPRWPFRNRRAI